MAIDIILTEDNTSALEPQIADDMQNCLKHFERELAPIRTSKAHTALIDNIPVSMYNGASVMPLKSVASLAAPDARLLTIEPWDKSIIGDIEKALQASDLGITPANDGNIIRLQLPEMSHERREELVKILHRKLEDCKIAIRGVRKEFNNYVKTTERTKAISENTSRRLLTVVQKCTDEFIKKAETMSKKKEDSLRSF